MRNLIPAPTHRMKSGKSARIMKSAAFLGCVLNVTACRPALATREPSLTPFVGCYQIQEQGVYAPFFIGESAWSKPPPGYPGFPRLVAIDTLRSQGGVPLLSIRTPNAGDWERNWSTPTVKGHTLETSWFASLGIWGLRHRVTLKNGDLVGTSWHWSDVPGRFTHLPTTWTRVRC
jgi:hypothetical protein